MKEERFEWLERYWYMDGIDRRSLVETSLELFPQTAEVPLPQCFRLGPSTSSDGAADCKQQ